MRPESVPTTPAGVALVTGAADGIGWATAQRLARAHAHVVLIDRDGAKAVERAAALGPAHLGLACEVTSEEEVEAVVDAVLRRFGRIDVLVNNAGIGDQAVATVAQSLDAFARLLAVHLHGSFLFSRACARAMLSAGGGAIVNLGSIVALGGVPGRNAYGAAKAGILAMTRSMACEWAGAGLRVNAVAPGYVRTALVERLAREGRVDLQAIERRTPMRRMAEPAEVAEAIAFLASPQASYITGATLSVDGGWAAFGAPESALGTGAQA